MTTKAPKYTIGLVRNMVDQSLLRAAAMQETKEVFASGSPVLAEIDRETQAELDNAIKALQRLQKLLIVGGKESI